MSIFSKKLRMEINGILYFVNENRGLYIVACGLKKPLGSERGNLPSKRK